MEKADQIDFKDGFAVKNKWIGDIPLGRISTGFKDISLHLTDFSIPELKIGTTTTSYKGVSMILPTHVQNPQSRTVKFSYMIDLNWDNYISLYQWANIIGNAENIMPNINTIIHSDLNRVLNAVPINVYLIDSYKKPILKFTYNNCWINDFEGIQLGYQEDPTVIKHTFTCAYTNFTVDRLS